MPNPLTVKGATEQVSYQNQQPISYKGKKVSIQDQDSYTKGKGGQQGRRQQGNQGQRFQQGQRWPEATQCHTTLADRSSGAGSRAGHACTGEQ
jgi:hypothetical protein